MKSIFGFAVAVGCTLAFPREGAAMKFQPLGELPNGFSAVNAYGVSDDGVVVGWGTNAVDGVSHSFRLVNGQLTVYDSYQALNVSGDGVVVVGTSSFNANPNGPAKWTDSQGEVSLMNPASFTYGHAYGVSHDGGVIVGSGHAAGTTQKPFRWTASTGMVSLGQLPRKPTGTASAVSGDGKVIVGWGYGDGPSNEEAFRWTAQGGIKSLGYLPDRAQRSYASATSFDGTFVVGSSENSWGREAFRWTENGGLKSLGDLPGGAIDSFASDISDDGSVVIGFATGLDFRGAVLWNQAGLITPLQDLLASRGVSGLEGWTLWKPNAISGDGRLIVGEGFGPRGVFEAWIVTIPEPNGTLLASLGYLGLRICSRRRLDWDASLFRCRRRPQG